MAESRRPSRNMTLINLFLISSVFAIAAADAAYSESHNCVLGEDLREEIASYNTVVQNIIDFVTNGDFRGRTYDELEKFVDSFGPRLSGSEVLEKSIDYMINLTRAEDLKDIFTEDVEVPHWLRGQESIEMLEPRAKNIPLLGLGFSVATPPEGITAEVVVVRNFTELDEMSKAQVEGKIVLYNMEWVSYGETFIYRVSGATKAAAKGAIASLVKSITPFSLYTTHTGMQRYGENVTKIPTAAITPEDANLIHMLYKKQKKVVLKIKMLSTLDYKTSRNTLIDLRGTVEPEKLVIVSGHIDSWDVGQGAMDDGGGLFISWAVPVILKQLKLQPKKTIRSIFWTAEELDMPGAKAYVNKHENELGNINFVMESDEGTFTPRGLAVAASQDARCIVAEVLKLFSSINATTLEEVEIPGPDIIEIVAKGVPGAGILNDNERYFWYHHSEADTMEIENPRDLDLNAAFYTAVAYVIADISVDIPRE